MERSQASGKGHRIVRKQRKRDAFKGPTTQVPAPSSSRKLQRPPRLMRSPLLSHLAVHVSTFGRVVVDQLYIYI